MESEGHLPIPRLAVRIILLDDTNRLLLVRFEDSSRQVSWWAAPGGALKPGESHEEALKREILEETGHHLSDSGSWIWTREHVFEFEGQQYRQHERFYSTRTHAFEPVIHGLEPYEKAYFRSLRWWTVAELEATRDELSPRQLPLLIRRLVEEGPPPEPIEVGV
jgi:8-oxo-dGTP pyrophosphatase MutT (NUDIX family)